MFANEDQAQAHVDQLIRQAQEHARNAQQMSVEMDALRVTGRSPDGAATVTVGQSGAVVDLQLTEKLDDATLVQIRAAILQANADAAARLSVRVSELAAQYYGEGSQTARELSGRWAEMLTPPPDDDAPRPEGDRR